jgi:hypothetical protein
LHCGSHLDYRRHAAARLARASKRREMRVPRAARTGARIGGRLTAHFGTAPNWHRHRASADNAHEQRATRRVHVNALRLARVMQPCKRRDTGTEKPAIGRKSPEVPNDAATPFM